MEREMLKFNYIILHKYKLLALPSYFSTFLFLIMFSLYHLSIKTEGGEKIESKKEEEVFSLR